MYSVTWIESTCVFYILYGVGHSEASICNYRSDTVNETGEKCQQIGSNSAQYIGPEKEALCNRRGSENIANLQLSTDCLEGNSYLDFQHKRGVRQEVLAQSSFLKLILI